MLIARRCAEGAIASWSKYIAYNGFSLVDDLTAVNVTAGGTVNQATEYEYADTHHAALVTLTKYPDGNTTIGMGEDNVQMSYNLDGSLATRKDQRGAVLTYSYDNARRLLREGATTIPGGVDDQVKSIARTYDTLGRPETISSYQNADGTGTVRNQIKYTYGAHGQITQSDQDHTDAVGTGTSHQSVQYAYDETASTSVYTNGVRLQTVTYPKTSRVIFSDYDSADTISDRLHRLNRIRETNSGGTILTQYSYNGVDRNVITDYQPPDVNLILYFGVSGSYHGFDRFGRVIDHMWDGYNATFDVARVKYGYDSAGNRTWREDVVAGNNGYNHDEYYTHDGLHRLKTFDRGNLTGGPPPTGIAGTPANEEDYTLDQLSNWPAYVVKAAGSTTLNQARSHNVVNEIDTDSTHGDADASITGTPNWADPIYDAAGNMTTMPKPADPANVFTLKYDAWNRLVAVSEPMSAYAYEYDGLGGRIVKDIPFTNDDVHYYYNQDWQMLEERVGVGTNPRAQYVWHPYYIDALAIRYYDADTDGNLAENNDGTHFYAHDANFNVTAIVNASGTVLERYFYSPYGRVTVLDANFAADADGVSDISNTHFHTGRERDAETGLQLNRHRFYANHLGRWLTRDPIGYWGGTNLYSYVGAMPTNYVDPLGLDPIPGGNQYGGEPWRPWRPGDPEPGLGSPGDEFLIAPCVSGILSGIGKGVTRLIGRGAAGAAGSTGPGLAGKTVKELKESTNRLPWNKLWGEGAEGAAKALERARRGEDILPRGITRENLDAYDELAKLALQDPDKSTSIGRAVQELRRQIIEEIRRRGR